MIPYMRWQETNLATAKAFKGLLDRYFWLIHNIHFTIFRGRHNMIIPFPGFSLKEPKENHLVTSLKLSLKRCTLKKIIIRRVYHMSKYAGTKTEKELNGRFCRRVSGKK